MGHIWQEMNIVHTIYVASATAADIITLVLAGLIECEIEPVLQPQPYVGVFDILRSDGLGATPGTAEFGGGSGQYWLLRNGRSDYRTRQVIVTVRY